MNGWKFRSGFGAVPALLLATSAFAQGLAITTPYGNETGCRVEAGGEYTSDDKFVLRSGGYEAHENSCEFVAVHTASDGAQLATALCRGEGMYWTTNLIVSPPDPESDSLLIFFDDGQLWHEVRPCS